MCPKSLTRLRKKEGPPPNLIPWLFHRESFRKAFKEIVPHRKLPLQFLRRTLCRGPRKPQGLRTPTEGNYFTSILFHMHRDPSLVLLHGKAPGLKDNTTFRKVSLKVSVEGLLRFQRHRGVHIYLSTTCLLVPGKIGSIVPVLTVILGHIKTCLSPKNYQTLCRSTFVPL